MIAVRAIVVLLLMAGASPAFSAKPLVLIYPSGPTVPENLLRIELRFSLPLKPPLTLEHVKLTDAAGVGIKDAFLDLLLPSADGKSVTVLMHPGRVKSGVGPNLALGRALRVGMKVTLVIAHPALGQPIRKNWQVTACDTELPQPRLWTFVPPRQGSRAPLVLHLDKPISSTAEYLIAIRGPDGNRFAGEGHLEQGETVWRFMPTRPWQAGSYAIVTHPDLEDAAGNRPGASFESAEAGCVRDEQGTVQPFAVTK